MAEQHTGDSAGDMPTPGRLVLAPAVRAVAGTACSVLPLRSPTGLAPPTTLSQSRRGEARESCGEAAPSRPGLAPARERRTGCSREVGSAKATPGRASQHPKPQPVVCISRGQPAQVREAIPQCSWDPAGRARRSMGGGSADPSRSGPGLLLPAHSGRPRAYVYFVKKTSSLQNQNVPARPASDRRRLLHAACALGVESGLVFREHPVLAEPSCSTVTVVLGGRNQDLREVPHRHVWPPDVTA